MVRDCENIALDEDGEEDLAIRGGDMTAGRMTARRRRRRRAREYEARERIRPSVAYVSNHLWLSKLPVGNGNCPHDEESTTRERYEHAARFPGRSERTSRRATSGTGRRPDGRRHRPCYGHLRGAGNEVQQVCLLLSIAGIVVVVVVTFDSAAKSRSWSR